MVIVLIFTVGVTMAILLVAYSIHPYAGVFVETIMTYQILAVKMSESRKHEGISGIKNRRDRESKAGSIDDRRERYASLR